MPPAMVCVPGTSCRCGSQQQSFLWLSGNRMLDLVGHCFKRWGCLLQAPRSMFSEKIFFFLQIYYTFHAKYAACGDQVRGLLVDMDNAKDTAVALYSSSQPYSLRSPVCSSQPSFPACAKNFAWGKVDFDLNSPKSLAS